MDEHLNQINTGIQPGSFPEYVLPAVPYFLLFILLEYLIDRYKRTRYYRINDALNSLATGMTQVVISSYIAFLGKRPYTWLFENYSLWQLPVDSPYTWWLGFLGIDLGYYWFHRASHELNIFWSAHVVHHSADDYNLTTALRQSAIQPLFSWMFYLPLAICLPPEVMHFHNQWNTIYQFWIHTRLLGKLGPLELLLNTPSHHRVHHGRNPIYIDKNYAGTLIIWDILFGTFEAESIPVVYGITVLKETWDPMYAQLHNFLYVLQLQRLVPSVLGKILTWFRGPGWVPDGVEAHPLPEVTPETQVRYDSKLPSGWMDLYVVIQFMIVLVMAEHVVTHRSAFPLVQYVAATVLTLASLSVWGMMYDNKRYALAVEAYRVLFFTALGIGYMWYYGAQNIVGVGAMLVAACAVCISFLAYWRGPYHEFVQYGHRYIKGLEQ